MELCKILDQPTGRSEPRLEDARKVEQRQRKTGRVFLDKKLAEVKIPMTPIRVMEKAGQPCQSFDHRRA